MKFIGKYILVPFIIYIVFTTVLIILNHQENQSEYVENTFDLLAPVVEAVYLPEVIQGPPRVDGIIKILGFSVSTFNLSCYQDPFTYFQGLFLSQILLLLPIYGIGFFFLKMFAHEAIKENYEARAWTFVLIPLFTLLLINTLFSILNQRLFFIINPLCF